MNLSASFISVAQPALEMAARVTAPKVIPTTASYAAIDLPGGKIGRRLVVPTRVLAQPMVASAPPEKCAHGLWKSCAFCNDPIYGSRVQKPITDPSIDSVNLQGADEDRVARIPDTPRLNSAPPASEPPNTAVPTLRVRCADVVRMCDGRVYRGCRCKQFHLPVHGCTLVRFMETRWPLRGAKEEPWRTAKPVPYCTCCDPVLGEPVVPWQWNGRTFQNVADVIAAGYPVTHLSRRWRAPKERQFVHLTKPPESKAIKDATCSSSFLPSDVVDRSGSGKPGQDELPENLGADFLPGDREDRAALLELHGFDGAELLPEYNEPESNADHLDRSLGDVVADNMKRERVLRMIPLAGLTDREMLVVQRQLAGAKLVEIARELGVTRPRITALRKTIQRKFGGVPRCKTDPGQC